jgi:exopolysaccharide production protein ExoZ
VLSGKLRSIQALRALAACAVVFHHAYAIPHPETFARVGAAGVDLFFVISGFIMSTIGGGRPASTFLRDRAWRIWPMWLIALTPWLFFRHAGVAETVSSATLWPIYAGTFHSPALHSGWTLCFEVLFYAAFALGLATRRWVPVAIFALCLAGSGPLFDFLGSPLILEFLAGVAIAALPRNQRLGPPLIVLSLCWFAVAPLGHGEDIMGAGAWLRLAAWGAPAAMLVYGALVLEQRFASRAWNLPVLLGDASYSIYLFHPLIAGNGNWVLGVVGAVGFGLAAYWFVERPIHSVRDKVRRSDQRPVPRTTFSCL